MKKVKIHILLVISLLGNVLSAYGMSNTMRSSLLKANQAKLNDMRAKFAAALPASFWSTVSLFASRFWKALADPKIHYGRVARIQQQTAKQMQQEISKQNLDQEKHIVDSKIGDSIDS